MSYMVLARKWRPRNFSEMSGQEHVLKALINALDRDQLHHAFLFSGTRGVGKTTIARILAKSLNCEQGVSSKPCGSCSACTEIDEGRFVDLIEVDAASRTGVDDTRELLDNVQYAPTRGRYKVYLIDEVHMLSKSAFNALLKTLEEPPPHVKFLLATTDPQKIPVTVLSRCLQFNLKRLSLTLIENRMTEILGEEGIEHEIAAIRLIARAADGSMRDGLSLLDQAIAFGGGQVDEAGVRSMLGSIQQESVISLIETVATGDAAAVLARVGELDELSPDYAGLLEDMVGTLQRIAVAQVVPEETDAEHPDREQVAALAAALAPEDVQLFYQIAMLGRRDLSLSPGPRGALEMVLLRMLSFRPLEAGQGPAPAAPQPARSAPTVAPQAPAPDASAPAAASEPAAPSPAPQAGAASDDWTALVDALGVSGMAGQLAAHCQLLERDERVIRLRLDQEQPHLDTEQARTRLTDALKRHLGEGITVRIEHGTLDQETPAARDQRLARARQAAAERSIQDDPNVRALQEQFDAQVQPGSVRPLDENETVDRG